MRTCKQCGRPIPVRNYGLRKFCSNSCKAIYRREYLKQKKKQYKQGNNKGSYINTYPNTGTIPDGFYEAIDTKTTLNPEDLKIAKECCNYEMKQRAGYCITLYEPYYGFKTECKDCYIFRCLKQALFRSKAEGLRGKYGRIIARDN